MRGVTARRRFIASPRRRAVGCAGKTFGCQRHSRPLTNARDIAHIAHLRMHSRPKTAKTEKLPFQETLDNLIYEQIIVTFPDR